MKSLYDVCWFPHCSSICSHNKYETKKDEKNENIYLHIKYISERYYRGEKNSTLQERFGKHLTITKGGVKIGLKDVDDYGSDPDTDALAEDSDLDVSTCMYAHMIEISPSPEIT